MTDRTVTEVEDVSGTRTLDLITINAIGEMMVREESAELMTTLHGAGGTASGPDQESARTIVIDQDPRHPKDEGGQKAIHDHRSQVENLALHCHLRMSLSVELKMSTQRAAHRWRRRSQTTNPPVS